MKRKKEGKALWMMAQLPFPDEKFINYRPDEPIDKNQALGDREKAKQNLSELGVLDDFRKVGLKVLDIGSGNGNTLGVLPTTSLLYGIEPSKKRREFAQENYPWVNFFAQPLEDVKLDDQFFDYIISFATFEHLRNPQLLIQRMYQWLKPDGKIILSFTNSGGIIPRLNLNEWRNADPEHQWLPSKKTAFKLLDKEGFKVIKYFTYGGIPAPRGFFKEILNKLIKLFNMGDILFLVARKK